MLILAYLLRSNSYWREAEIFLKLVVPDATAAQAAKTNLKQFVDSLRIGASCKVIEANGREFPEILQESSQKADLVFLGMATPGENFTQYYEQMQQRLLNLPTTILVLASPSFDYQSILGES